MQLPEGNENYICYPCANLLYSDGFSGCRDCDYWQLGAPLSFFRTSLINTDCYLPPIDPDTLPDPDDVDAGDVSEKEDSTDEKVTPRSEKVSTDDAGSSSKGWVVPVVIILVIVIAVISATIVVVKGLCCNAFYNRFSKL